MKKILSFLLITVIALSIASCGGAGGSDKSYGGDDNVGFVSEQTPSAPREDMSPTVNESKTEGGDSSLYGKKVIYTCTLNLETLEYEKSYRAINEAVSKYKGYVENSYERGGETYSGERSYNRKNLTLTIRIPVENYEAFLAERDSFGNVTSLNNQMQDITSDYIDIEARLSTLKQTEQRLVELMKKAGSLSEMIELENARSNTRYEIESYTSRINAYDNQISYCTVTLYLNEVATITISDNFWQKAVKAIKNSWASFVTFLQDAVIFVIYALPYAILAFGAIFAVRKLSAAYYAKHPEKTRLKAFKKSEKKVEIPKVYKQNETPEKSDTE